MLYFLRLFMSINKMLVISIMSMYIVYYINAYGIHLSHVIAMALLQSLIMNTYEFIKIIISDPSLHIMY